MKRCTTRITQNPKAIRHYGFTLIELIGVIVIISILSSTVVSRFIDLRSDANEAVFNTVYASFKTGIDNFHLLWEIRQGTASTSIPEYNNLLSSWGGYPYGLVQRDGWHRIKFAEDCIDIFHSIMHISGMSIGKGSNNGGTLGSTTDITATSHQRNCIYYYTAMGNKNGDMVPGFFYNSLNGQLHKKNYRVRR